MEIKNLQTLIIGSGKQIFNAYFTIDLIPFHLIVKYDINNRGVNFGWGVGSIGEVPEYISKFYTVEIYQTVIDMVCDKFGLEKRELESFGNHKELPLFDFKTEEYCYEFQYYGNFGRVYYTKTKIQNALKAHEQWLKTFSDRDKQKDDDFRNMSNQIDEVIDGFRKQKVFSNRDYIRLSHSTLDKFIDNFKRKAK